MKQDLEFGNRDQVFVKIYKRTLSNACPFSEACMAERPMLFECSGLDKSQYPRSGQSKVYQNSEREVDRS